MADPYVYQKKLAFWGDKNQELLQDKKIVIIGCGALGSNIADQLTRLGIRHLTLIDSDVIEESNLHRVSFYTKEDLGKSKAQTASTYVTKINPLAQPQWQQIRVDKDNLANIVQGADLLMDGCDNMATRAAINSVCNQLSIPWVYGGLLATSAMILPILPGKSACLNCLLPNLNSGYEPPKTSELGILPTLPRLTACYQVTAALKIMLNQYTDEPRLISVDLWQDEFNLIKVHRLEDCPTCSKTN